MKLTLRNLFDLLLQMIVGVVVFCYREYREFTLYLTAWVINSLFPYRFFNLFELFILLSLVPIRNSTMNEAVRKYQVI